MHLFFLIIPDDPVYSRLIPVKQSTVKCRLRRHKCLASSSIETPWLWAWPGMLIYQLYFTKMVAVEQSEKNERKQIDIKIIIHKIS